MLTAFVVCASPRHAEWQSDLPPVAPNQEAWLQRHLEDKMWRAADVAQLQRLGAADSLLIFPQPMSAAQQGKAGAGRQPAASGLPGQQPSASMLSSPPAAAAASPGGDAAAAAGAGSGGAAGAAAEGAAGAAAHPDWMSCPLALMHSVLQQAAGRLTVYSLVLTEARRMEKGGWEGLLRISRSAGTGLRFAYWLGQPLVVAGELQALRGGPGTGAAAEPAAAVAGAAAAPAAPKPPTVEVNLEESGALAIAHSPQLVDPLSGRAVALRLSPTSLSIEELLLSAAGHNAAVQLGEQGPGC